MKDIPVIWCPERQNQYTQSRLTENSLALSANQQVSHSTPSCSAVGLFDAEPSELGRIYILPVHQQFQPTSMPARYPGHNDFYGVEQDFLLFLQNHKELITHDWQEAKWHYLPVFWTHWLVSHDYGKRDLDKLQHEVNRCILDDSRTFTICQYADGPLVDIGMTNVFLSSRNTERGIDIPCLCAPHKKPSRLPVKKYLASFVGRLSTGEVRRQMAENLKGHSDILITDRSEGTDYFAQTMLESYIALSPRGYGGGSFRFYEAMQLGTVPFLIGNIDTRAFKDFINWDEVSFYAPDASDIAVRLRRMNKQQLLEMGAKAAKVWAEELSYQNWCRYVIKELQSHSDPITGFKVDTGMSHFLSFIIPCYNCADTVGEAIESIYQQNLDIPFEVVCTDDGSEDSTREVLSYYQNKYSNLNVHYHDQNMGVYGGAAAANTCVANSKGDLIFRLDSDNILVPDSVSKLIKLLDETGCDGATVAELRYFEGSKGNYRHSHSWFYEAPNNICDISHILSTTRTPAASGNYLYTRKSFDRVGGYPNVGLDSLGFGFRQHATGGEIAILPGTFYWHRLSANSCWVHDEKRGVNGKYGATIFREFPELFTDETNGFLASPDCEKDFFKHLKSGRFKAVPKQSLAYLFQGYREQLNRKYSEAVNSFSRAISSGCKHWKVVWCLSQAAYNAGNMNLAKQAVGVVTELAPNFIEAKDLLQQIGCKPERQTNPKVGRTAGNQVKTIDNNGDVLRQIKEFGLWNEGKPLRLHLGCGQNHFDGYINIDYPPSEHNLIRVKADIHADIKSLDFPSGSVDEVRLHHVFEHFNRVTALAMLIKWHKWLKIGGRIHIETPDLIGSAKTLVSNASWKTKMGVVRHLAGDQAANWGYHVDHWFGERFERTLGALGFESIQTWSTSWTKEPYLANVKVTAVKTRGNSLQQQLKAAEKLLWESTVSLEERSKWEVWKKQLHAVLAGDFVASPSNTQTPDVSSVSAAPTILSQNSSRLPLDEIHGFNQRSRNRWVQAKARTVPAGSRVLDVGAGTCPYRSFFKHCDYKTHDFKKYKGIKKGNTTEFGQIDYVSDICKIPVPDNSFDVILCTEVLEHVVEPIEALREMLRIVRPGGRILITAPLGSGLHQLPYHFYGGFSPEWYRYFFDKFGCRVVEVTPNGGFFKLLAQECARVQWTLPQHQHLHGSNVEFIRHLFGEWLPRYLFSLEEECFIDQFTVGYHVEAIKVANAKLLISDSEICQWDKRRMEAKLNKNTISPICSKDSTMQAQNSHWPVITMSALGKFGRFGNQLFQYASLRIYAKKYNLRTETPKWIGQRLFGCYDPPIQKKLPLVEVPNKLVPFWEDPTFYAKQPLTSVDLKGYFQYHTKYYVKYKEHLRSLFSPLPEIEAKMRVGLESLCSKGKTLVGLHLRRGDFGHHHHFIAPSQWYKEWLKGFWETLEDPVLFIASDEPEKVVSDFVEYKPVTSAQLGMELAEAPFYPDFYILTQCDAVAISNSTFSFVACMLNKRGKIFARPTLSNRKLIPFDPWNSESNFKNEKVAANESYHEQTDACTETGSTASSGDSNSFCRNSGTLVSGNEKNRDITVKPKISVLMSVYNGERFVTEALKSVYNQTYQDFEVIIVDDCSTDRTSEILLNLKDSRTCIYKNPENLGLTKSLNIGLKLCRGEYVARMDADDISHPQRFERQIKFLDENPDCLVLGCWYGRIDSGGKILGSKEPPTEYEDTKKQLLIEACVGHGTAIVRRAALVEVGGYNEQYTYAQDYDLWLRLSEVGLIRNLDEYLYLLRSWPGNITTIKLKEQTEFAELAISQALQRRYGNGPIDREVSYGFVKRAITWFNLREYENCINTLNNTQKMAPNVTKRFKGYDLLLALAYFAIGREQQCLTCLRREIQNHNNPAAGKFLSDYFEKNLRMDVHNWCSQNSRHYNLQLVDLEKESCQQRQNNNITEPYVSKKQSEQKGIRQSLARLAVLYQDKGETARERSNLEKTLSTRHDFGWAKDMLPDAARQSSSTESQTGRQKILFYFDRIGNLNETSPAGTVIAVLNFARALQSSNPDIKVHITGDLVRYLEKYESFQVVPLPNAEERGKFLTDYDVVFFATHVRYFQGLTKPSGQIWVLYQHCWEAGDYVSLSHTSDFDIVICLSELHRASLREQHIGDEKLITIPNLIDTNVYSPGYIQRNNHSIMFAGGLHPHKCIHILLDAFRLVRQQVQDAGLHIYGDGQMWRGGDDYGNYLKGIKPEGVHFHGYVSNKDMPQIYSKHSILCQPSKLETFPMVIVEAQACGCIPVAHNAGGVTATLADEQTGLLYSPNTPEKLAETIIKAIKIADADPSVRQKAINFVRNTFSINRAAEYISKLWGRITIAKKVNTIRTLLEGNEIEQADFECEKLLQKNPNHPDVQLLHALIMLQQGNEPKADVAIGELLENFPNHLRALNDFGLMAMKAGDTEKALRYLTKAYKFNPWDKDTITNCYAILTTSGKYRDAKMLLLNYLTNVGEDAQVLQLFREIDNLIANTDLGTNVVSQEVLNNRQDIYCESNTSMPLVSIITPVYNGADYIGQTIESVLAQDYPNFELVIIDDGSTDNTKKVILRYNDGRIKYLYQENKGVSSARNLAIKKTKGQYIMPLDADDMMTPDFIVKHLAEFEKYPDADLVYCDVLLIDGNSNPIRIMNKPEYQDRRHLIRDLFRAGHPIIPFRFGIKRSVFDKIGFYDEDLLIGEDYDMMRRFVKAGLKAHHLSEPLHLRRMQAGSLSTNYSTQKAKSHFDVVKRFTDTFTYDELFPDIEWDKIAPEVRQLHAKCLTAGTYLTIGQNYVRTKAIECSRIAFDLVCSEINDCVKMDPENQGLRQLLQKSKLIRAKYTEAPQQVVS